MAISENKMQIVIDNYFKSECDINTSIRSAFEKGFRIGVKKASSAQPEVIRCKYCKWWDDGRCYCDDVDVRDQEYMVGDMRTEATHFCGYAGRREE